MKVFIYGAGKVGRALARLLRARGDDVVLRPARRGVPRRPIDASVIVLAVRDKELGPLASALAAAGVVPRTAVCVHNAGSQPAEVLAPLRAVCRGVAQMHPMIAFASTSFAPSVERGHCHVRGDAPAEARARTLARRLGMVPRTFAKLDPVGYHAAAGLLANGAAALAAAAAALLDASGVPASDVPKMLGPLLRSVGDNVEGLGFPESLTGPVRRGDAAGIERQILMLGERLPAVLPLYVASARAQLPLARATRDARPADYDAVEAVLDRHTRGRRSRS